ncbi:uncharacterized protein IL334_003157 [Kwoniella shivajii]|uniref:Thaumatin family protein n=1 Tax=Kwoniella shivajii TaxID=564305 RepID=A0ABZ1CWS2_9TREE|nr:hypothetical protein IL334_003157 [Kwoniella shivajii]
MNSIYPHLSLLTFLLLISSIDSRQITVKNSCKSTIWPGLHSGDNKTQPFEARGWELGPKQEDTFPVPDDWTSGRIWARTGCTINELGLFVCLTGNCGNGSATDSICHVSNDPPATLAEFTLSPNGSDNYDISLVDGFNVPLNIYNSDPKCTSPICEGNINKYCPSVLKTGLDTNGINLGCMTPCNAGFGDELYGNRACCTGAYGNDSMLCESCGMDYYDLFKDNCNQAYAYAYDEKSGTLFQCDSTPTSMPNYTIEFCPNDSEYIGQIEPDLKYLGSTATCSSIATYFDETFSIRPSPTKILTSGTLDVVATVATGINGAAAIQLDGIGSAATATATASSTSQNASPASGITTTSSPTTSATYPSGSDSETRSESEAQTNLGIVSVPQTIGPAIPGISVVNHMVALEETTTSVQPSFGTSESPSTSAPQTSEPITSTRIHTIVTTTTLPDGSSSTYEPKVTSAFTVINGNTLYQVLGGSKTAQVEGHSTQGAAQGQWLKAVPMQHAG